MNVFGRVFTRGFHSTPTQCAKHSKRRLEVMLKKVPAYPYPIKPTFKQSWFGLYGGKHIQFGNNIPDSRYKTRRYWMPNIRHKKLYSRALKQWIQLTVATSVLRRSHLRGRGMERMHRLICWGRDG
jgi:large subunit ribosomal protein L28